MKTYHSREAEALRAEVRALQMEVNRLENRLANYEEAEVQEMRALWPYCWILSGVETIKGAIETKHEPKPKRKVATNRPKAPQSARFDPGDGEARFARMMM